MGEQIKVADVLVVDSGGFLRDVSLRSMANTIITIHDVIHEIRDKATKARLQILPYELQFREPSAEAIYKINQFSKQTGDYPSLSATDVKVLALTYMLEVEKNGDNHLQSKPIMNKTTHFYHPGKDCKIETQKLPGFYEGSDDDDEEEEEKENENTKVEKLEIFKEQDIESDSRSKSPESDLETRSSTDDDTESGEWITPSNLKEKTKRMTMNVEMEVKDKVHVACMTTDFAMQNVCKQMGLHVVSVDGLLIQTTKTWILRCYSCFTTTSIMSKCFCPRCGNKTLKRVSVTLNSDGSQQIHISSRRPLTTRGKKFSLPKHRGGKHGVNPILCEDQRLPQQRTSRLAQQKTNAYHPDYTAGNSPFSLHDVTSKSALLGTPGVGALNNLYWMKKNPNSFSKSTGNRKKKNRK